MFASFGETVRRAPGRVAGAAAVAVLVVGVMAGPAIASEPAFHVEFPQGVACADFAVGVDGYGDGSQVYREFTDRDGNVVRTLSAGIGYSLTFTNLTTYVSLSTRANGAVNSTRFNADGTRTVTATGHNVIFMYPTDVPAGPSTTLYVGRVVYTVDATETFTLLSMTGRSVDICSALGG